jgi:ADP-ribose pyrophosphatase YjhB (NUDIX family)
LTNFWSTAEVDGSLDHTALRILATKTRVALPHLEQVATHSGPDRDPRGWSVTTLYYALLPSDQVPAVAGDKTESIEWCDPERPGHRLVFDHRQLKDAPQLVAVEGEFLRGAQRPAQMYRAAVGFSF